MHYSENNFSQNIPNSCSLNRRLSENKDNTRNDNLCNNTCGLKKVNSRQGSWGLTGHPLASVYAPLQDFENIYDCETSLIRGTIFKELDLPFCGKSVVRGGSICD